MRYDECVKKFPQSNFTNAGQSLIEVSVAATALIFVLVAVVSGLILSVRNTTFSKTQALATQQTQEGIEIFQRFRNELGWETFYQTINADGSNTTYCIMNDVSTTTQFQNMQTGGCSVSATFTGFVREAIIDVRSTTEVAVEVRVEWRDGTEDRATSAKQIFQRRS